MKKLALILSSLLLASPLVSQIVSQTPAPVPEVILLGSMHEYHFRDGLHYSLVDLKNELEILRPDVICGEITPEAYTGAMEGYFPPEAAYVAEIAPTLNARFVPADWRISHAWQSRAEKMEPRKKTKAEAAIGKQQSDGITNFKGVSVFDYLHSETFIGLSDRQFEKVIGENNVSDIAAGGWHERNRKIVENCLDGSQAAHRIVILFGSNHIAQLRRQLAARGVTAQIATRRFTPAGLGSVSPAVLARWQHNLENLHGILSGTIAVSHDSLDKVKDSHRVRDLEFAIKTYSPAS